MKSNVAGLFLWSVKVKHGPRSELSMDLWVLTKRAEVEHAIDKAWSVLRRNHVEFSSCVVWGVEYRGFIDA